MPALKEPQSSKAPVLQVLRNCSCLSYHAEALLTPKLCQSFVLAFSRQKLHISMIWWYEFSSAMHIFRLLKLFNNFYCFDIIFDICFAVHLIPVEQFICLQVL